MPWGASGPATMKKSNDLITIPATVEISVVQLVVSILVIIILQYYVLKHLMAPKSTSEQQQQQQQQQQSNDHIRGESATLSVTLPSRNLASNSNDKLVPEKNGTKITDVKEVHGVTTPNGTPARNSIPISRSGTGLSYRMQQEGAKKMSSEYTRRGQLWSKHASWNLPMAPRTSLQLTERQTFGHNSQGLEHVTAILNKFDVDPRRGFLPSQDPLQRLPYARYHLWEDLGDDLPKLLGARLGQAREPLKQLPALATDKLVTDAELRRAHLLLCLFAHAYVWGGPEPLDVIPEGIAKPLWEVSKRLDMPPVLGHPSIVLYNWRRLDSEAGD